MLTWTLKKFNRGGATLLVGGRDGTERCNEFWWSAW